MNGKKFSNADLSKAQSPGLRFVVVALLLVSVGAVLIHFKQRSSDQSQQRAERKQQRAKPADSNPERRSQGATVSHRISEDGGDVAAATNPAESSDLNAGRKTMPPASLPEPTPLTRHLVSSLSLLDHSGNPMTAEQAAEWKQNFQLLLQQGRDAVPAIIEFLKQNKDVSFDARFGGTLGYASVRTGMIDALSQIGGSEAILGTLQILQTTADPREIALLAQKLEKLAPELYRQEAIRAAREALAMAADRKLEGSDVAPLFEVIHKFGDVNVVADLQQDSKQWNYYSTMALAKLPDGMGISALIQIAESNAGAKGNALEMLTELSSQYSEARVALLDMVRANKIASNMWPYLTPLLAGDRYHFQDSTSENSLPSGERTSSNSAYVVFGNQHFYTAPDLSSLTAEDFNQRMAFMDEMQSATSDPAAAKALQQSRDLLAKRTTQAVAVSR